MIHEVRDYGWSRVGNNNSNDSFYTWGTVGLASFILIFFQAWSPIRHAFYEIFLHFHVFLTGVALAGIWVHYQTKDLFQLFLVQVALGIWGLERVLRLIWLGFRNFGGTEAEVEVLPGECLRIRLKVARPWRFKAGQHVYLYMPRIGWWTSHPFSLAWSEAILHVVYAGYGDAFILEYDFGLDRRFVLVDGGPKGRSFSKKNDRKSAPYAKYFANIVSKIWADYCEAQNLNPLNLMRDRTS